MTKRVPNLFCAVIYGTDIVLTRLLSGPDVHKDTAQQIFNNFCAGGVLSHTTLIS